MRLPLSIFTSIFYNVLEHVSEVKYLVQVGIRDACDAELAYASKNGCRIVDGLGMLIYQAIPGFERWFGVKPADSQDLRELLLK